MIAGAIGLYGMFSTTAQITSMQAEMASMKLEFGNSLENMVIFQDNQVSFNMEVTNILEKNSGELEKEILGR